MDFDTLQKIVNDNNKKRFQMEQQDDEEWYIRAVQGHSLNQIQTEQLLEPLNIEEYKNKNIIHGTFKDAWKFIVKTGLNKMGRNHVHFSIGYPGDKEVISGMRSTCEIFIEIDLELAQKNGVKFYISQNKVILSEGINGAISPMFFKKVYEQTSEGKKLIFSNENLDEMKKQYTFKNILVLDFECNNDKIVDKLTREIIEFPIVVYNTQENIIEKDNYFHHYVKPTIHPELTEFIKGLTGISQDQVDKGEILQKVLILFEEWYKKRGFDPEETCFVTCGDFDFRQLYKECKNKKIQYTDLLKTYINIKDIVRNFENVEKKSKLSMTDMLEIYKIKLDGKHHSGIDDSFNIAKIFKKLIDQGYLISKSFAKTN